MDMTTLIAAMVGAAVSWILEKVPGVKDQFNKLTPNVKVFAVIVAVVILTIGLLYGGCQGLIEGLPCAPYENWLVIVVNVMAAVLSSQVWHSTINK